MQNTTAASTEMMARLKMMTVPSLSRVSLIKTATNSQSSATCSNALIRNARKSCWKMMRHALMEIGAPARTLAWMVSA
jgi:hypothetical protein